MALMDEGGFQDQWVFKAHVDAKEKGGFLVPLENGDSLEYL